MSWQIRAAAQQRAAYRQLAAHDVAMGYPRRHARDEPGWQVGARCPDPYTETHTWALQHSDGRVAIRLTPEVAALASTVVVIDDGGPVSVTITATQTHVALPGDAEDWQPVPVRGGLPPLPDAADGKVR